MEKIKKQVPEQNQPRQVHQETEQRSEIGEEQCDRDIGRRLARLPEQG